MACRKLSGDVRLGEGTGKKDIGVARTLMYGGLGQVLPRTWLSAVRVDASPLARAILVVCSSMADNDKAIKDRLYLRNAGYFDWYDLIDGDDTCRHLPLIGGMGILMPARRVFSNQSMARDVTRSFQPGQSPGLRPSVGRLEHMATRHSQALAVSHHGYKIDCLDPA